MADRLVALVTGANKGLGFEICRQLAAKGYSVVLTARNPEKGRRATGALQQQGFDVYFVRVDLEDPSTFDSAVTFVERTFGKLDVLMNNAGFAIDWEYRADTVPLELVRKTFEANFFGLMDLTQRLIPLIRKSPAGRIVNHASILGSLTLRTTPNSGLEQFRAFAYNASKTAVNAFTVHLADALRDTPIKVNSAHPGQVKTDANPMGTMDVREGAKTAVDLATLPADGPTGCFFHLGNQLPW
jgi:NAD(P)-dependent dehydrogenase (short-subunit alcohol dehydrogenase family)